VRPSGDSHANIGEHSVTLRDLGVPETLHRAARATASAQGTASVWGTATSLMRYQLVTAMREICSCVDQHDTRRTLVRDRWTRLGTTMHRIHARRQSCGATCAFRRRVAKLFRAPTFARLAKTFSRRCSARIWYCCCNTAGAGSAACLTEIIVPPLCPHTVRATVATTAARAAAYYATPTGAVGIRYLCAVAVSEAVVAVLVARSLRDIYLLDCAGGCAAGLTVLALLCVPCSHSGARA
jgi:hypothetical protein